MTGGPKLRDNIAKSTAQYLLDNKAPMELVDIYNNIDMNTKELE